MVILDSPVYKLSEHGEQMRAERQSFFESNMDSAPKRCAASSSWTEPMLQELSRELQLTWRIHRPWYGLALDAASMEGRFAGRRPPSTVLDTGGTFQVNDCPAPSSQSTRPRTGAFRYRCSPWARFSKARKTTRSSTAISIRVPMRHDRPDRAREAAGNAGRVGDARPADGCGHRPLQGVPRTLPTCPHRLGRIFPIALSRCRAERAVCGLCWCAARAKTRYLELLEAMRAGRDLRRNRRNLL